MTIDIEQYRHHLGRFALTEAQQADLIRSLYLVMESFVDLAFGTDATQISLGITEDQDSTANRSELDSTALIPSTFNDAAKRFAAGKTDS